MGVVGGGPPPRLGLGGMKRHDMRSSPGGWGFSQIEEMRWLFVSLYGMRIREDTYLHDETG